VHFKVLIVLLAIALVSCAQGAQRQATVEQRSVQVMPFDMNTSMHVFTPTAAGGVQAVMIHNGDRKQIELVRQHLKKEAAAFATGDFSDPAYIHGNGMPGLNELERDHARLSVVYSNISEGGKIVYRSADPRVIAAVHEWFKAQVRDHGAHAMTGTM
jgi:hypothetical protein